jgi:hypothetical protein
MQQRARPPARAGRAISFRYLKVSGELLSVATLPIAPRFCDRVRAVNS